MDARPDAGGDVQVHLLDGGSFSTATLDLLHAEAGPEQFRMYNWCFLIIHKRSGRRLLWDLGCSHDNSLYTPWVQTVQVPAAGAVGPRITVSEQLLQLGVTAGQIDTVVFSHAHWDHCRPISHEFPQAIALFGPGTKAFCSPGHLVNGIPKSDSEWDGRYFDESGFATERCAELNGPWQVFAPFEKAHDFFGDGSFWIADAPGHMPGNLCALVRLEGSREWVLLGGDCCHSQSLLSGQSKVAVYQGKQGETVAYLHKDLDAAERTIETIRKAKVGLGAHICLAHDDSWLANQEDSVLLSLLSEHKQGEWLQAVKRQERP